MENIEQDAEQFERCLDEVLVQATKNFDALTALQREMFLKLEKSQDFNSALEESVEAMRDFCAYCVQNENAITRKMEAIGNNGYVNDKHAEKKTERIFVSLINIDKAVLRFAKENTIDCDDTTVSTYVMKKVSELSDKRLIIPVFARFLHTMREVEQGMRVD